MVTEAISSRGLEVAWDGSVKKRIFVKVKRQRQRTCPVVNQGHALARGARGRGAPSIELIHAAVLTAVLFFAYVSFFRRRELIETVFGRAVGWFIAVFYVQRGLTECEAGRFGLSS